MNATGDVRVIPDSIYEHLRMAVIAYAADFVLSNERSRLAQLQQHLARTDAAPGHLADRMLHPGDRFGDYLIWLWREGQHDEVVLVLADLSGEIRYHHRDADPSITLSQLLSWTRMSLAPLETWEVDALIDAAQGGVPDHFRSDVEREG